MRGSYLTCRHVFLDSAVPHVYALPAIAPLPGVLEGNILTMTKHLIHWIFATCVSMGLLLLAIGMTDSVPNAGGQPHAAYPGMIVGADGAARLAQIGVLAFLFNSLLLTLVVCLCILGVSERRRSPKFLAGMGVSFMFMQAIWLMMFSSHQEFLQTSDTGYFMGFPVPTAWQVYGTWVGAIPLILMYSCGFRKFIYTHDDEEEFNAILTRAGRDSLQE